MSLTSTHARRTARPIVVAGLVALVCALAILGAMSTAASASPLVWSGVNEVGPPAAAPSGENRVQLSDISCSAAGDCVAIGTDEPRPGWQAIVVEETNGVWGKAAYLKLPEAAKVLVSQLESIDCPAAGDCTAVGYDEVVTKKPQLLVVSENAGTWEEAQVIQPPASSLRAILNSVSCAGSGSCTAVGESESESTKNYEAVAVTQKNGTWEAAATVSQPADAYPYGALQSVSCSAAGECAATGWYRSKTTNSYDFMGAYETGGTWSTGETIAIPDGGEPYQLHLYVSCVAPGACDASGYDHEESGPNGSRAVSASYAGGKWSSNAQSIGSIGHEDWVYAPSCPASGSCAAVGASVPAEEKYEALVASSTAGVWSAQTISPPSNAATEAQAKALKDDVYAELYKVSCWAVGACEAVGEYITQTGEYAAMAATEAGGVWSGAQEVAPPSNSETGEAANAGLNSVSCAANAVCASSGTYVDNAGEYRGMTVSAASAPLEVASSALPVGQVGTAYSAQLSATGGLGPYAWSVTSGSLPAGLSLNATTGVISGTPIGAGGSFTVGVATNVPPAQATQRALSITINQAPVKSHPPKPAVITIVSPNLTVTKHQLQVKLSCQEAVCRGVVKVVAIVKVRVRHKGKFVTKKRTVVLASGDYKIAAGKNQAIAIKLTAAGRTLLSKLGKHHSLRVKLIVTVNGGVVRSKTVKLS